MVVTCGKPLLLSQVLDAVYVVTFWDTAAIYGDNKGLARTQPH